jgi:hypothetical protein
MFLVFLNHFDAMMSNLKKIKKYYFNTFRLEKFFEKQPQPHSQTSSKSDKSKIIPSIFFI